MKVTIEHEGRTLIIKEDNSLTFMSPSANDMDDDMIKIEKDILLVVTDKIKSVRDFFEKIETKY